MRLSVLGSAARLVQQFPGDGGALSGCCRGAGNYVSVVLRTLFLQVSSLVFKGPYRCVVLVHLRSAVGAHRV